jgi:hypothetical protein
MSETASVKLQRFLRVMTGGLVVTDELIGIRNGKAIAEIAKIKNARDLGDSQNVRVKSLHDDYQRLETARLHALTLNGNAEKSRALDTVKQDAKGIARGADGRAKDIVYKAKGLPAQLQMADYWCKAFAKYRPVKPLKDEEESEESSSEEDPNLAELKKAFGNTLHAIGSAGNQLGPDPEAAIQTWNGSKKAFDDALAEFGRLTIGDRAGKHVETLILENPNGPEKKMQDALGKDKFMASLIKSVQTAIAFGVNNDALSPGEQVAIFTYTAVDYRKMNKHLQSKAKGGQGEGPDYEVMCTETRSALAKLPPYVGQSVRGEADWPGANAQYRLNNVFATDAFWSSGIGLGFSKHFKVTINGQTGRNVASLSNSPNEAEILFAPGTRFKVTKRTDHSAYDVEVELDEVV